MRSKPVLYVVEKKFIGGALAGLVIKELTNVKFTLGQLVEKPVGGSPYKITSISRA